jgi:hypothetical protein
MRNNNSGSRAASRILLLSAIVLMLAANMSAGTIQYQVGTIGIDSYHYNFILGGMRIDANQQLEIRFDPNIYLGLGNGTAGSDFNLTLLQPNNPKGTFGDYTATAFVNNASLAGPFGVDVQIASGSIPGSQAFVINQLDAGGKFVSTIQSGSTTPAENAVPEPASGFLAGAALFFGLFSIVRNRARRAA